MPDIDEIIDIIKKHYNLLCQFKKDRIAINEMRKHITWYLKGLRGSNAFKNKINTTKDKDEVFALLNDYREEYKQNVKEES